MRTGFVTLVSLVMLGGCVEEEARPSAPAPVVRPSSVQAPRAAIQPARASATHVSESARVEPTWDDAAALRTLAESCERGVNRDCWLLGVAYELHGEPRASVLYRQACREGARGCVEAARTHPEQAAQHLALGCRHGAGPACRAWAALEDLPDSDRAEARTLGCRAGWLEACEARLPGCGGSAAVCVRRAEEALARGDRAAATRLSLLVCDGEHTTGCDVWARASMNEDAAAAEVALERACRAEDPAGCRALAGLGDDEHRALFGRIAAALERR